MAGAAWGAAGAVEEKGCRRAPSADRHRPRRVVAMAFWQRTSDRCGAGSSSRKMEGKKEGTLSSGLIL